MAARYYVDEKNGILVGVASGLVRADELISEANRVFTETDGAAFLMNHLFVVEKNALSSMIDETAMLRIRAFAESWAKKFPGHHTRTAVLVKDSAFKEKLFEKWKEIIEDAMHYHVDTRIMKNRDEAIAWLTEPGQK